MMITYLQDTRPLLNDWSMISTASGVYKKLIINFKKFWQMGVDLIIQPGTSINFLSGSICSILCISVTFFFL